MKLTGYTHDVIWESLKKAAAYPELRFSSFICRQRLAAIGHQTVRKVKPAASTKLDETLDIAD